MTISIIILYYLKIKGEFIMYKKTLSKISSIFSMKKIPKPKVVVKINCNSKWIDYLPILHLEKINCFVILKNKFESNYLILASEKGNIRNSKLFNKIITSFSLPLFNKYKIVGVGILKNINNKNTLISFNDFNSDNLLFDEKINFLIENIGDFEISDNIVQDNNLYKKVLDKI